jgi:NADH pyrophosphatase NudC (nudix superfamily)
MQQTIWDTIIFMDPEINPVLRIFAIILLFLTPIAVVILQRLSDIRQIIQDHKDGKLSFNPGALFNSGFGDKKPARPDIVICPKCHSINPHDHQFCGYCGTAIQPKKEG